jgi:hypothetical protein
MAAPPKESPYRLLVEGSDDLHSVIHLMARHGFDWEDERKVRPFVSPMEGVEKLLQAIPVALKGTYERIGIVLDANSSLVARWAQLRDRANRADIALPESPESEGTIVEGRQPGFRVGIWLMPDNSSPGTLENFLGELVPPDHPVWAYAGEVTVEARQRGAGCLEKDHLKSTLHTWLAWQEEPGLPFGTALRTGVFEVESETARRFVAWFNRLFVEA